MSRSNSPLKLLRGAVLVAVLLVMQTAVLSHVDSDDAHPGADTCVLCVGVSTLGAADVATPVVISGRRTFAFLPTRQIAAPRPGSTRLVLPRGPPAVS